MFASLKNKIKEETGSDLTKLPILNNPSQKLTSTSKGRHSRQGSGSSIGSSSFDGITEERASSSLSVIKQDSFENKPPEEKVLVSKEIRRLEKQEDEWRKRLQKKEEEWVKKLENKEEEWKKQLEEKQWDWKRSLELLEKEKSVLEEEKREVVKQKLSLEESLKVAEEYKRKVFQYQEDIDQLEGFQTQEMSKIKHLLLVKEQEVAEMVNALKESTQQVEMLRAEVTRLRRYEEELNNVQEKAEEERLQLQSRVEEIQKRTKSIEMDHAELAVMLRDEKKEHDVLKEEVALLREMLEKERARYTDLNLAFDKERQEKDTILMRNAQVNQQMELARQELRAQEQEATELHSKVVSLETAQGDRIKELDRRRMEVENLSKRIEELEIVQHDKQAAGEQEQELRGSIAELEDQLTEKNKTIRILQQRLGDMKKTLQRELRLPPQSLDNSAGVDVEGGVAITAILTPTSSKHVQPKHTSNHRSKEEEDDVNFKYLKHVLIKFLTSREYEAQHLTRAVATLLRFSPEEERLLRETLDWKMSWFGTRPSLGIGQTSKTIPNS